MNRSVPNRGSSLRPERRKIMKRQHEAHGPAACNREHEAATNRSEEGIGVASETRYSFTSCAASAVLIALLAMWSGVGRAATLRVPTGYPAIQSAIAASQDGDTVLVDAGTYTESLDLSGKAVTLQGVDGAGQTVVSGNGEGNVVTADGGGKDSEIIGFTITGGDHGVLVHGAGLTIRSSVLTGNSWGCAQNTGPR
jgi:hypothetical protein